MTGYVAGRPPTYQENPVRRRFAPALVAILLATGSALITAPPAHADVDNGEFAISTNHAQPGTDIAAGPLVDHGCPAGQGVKTWQVELDFNRSGETYNSVTGPARADGSWTLRVRVPRIAEPAQTYSVSAKCFGRDSFGGNASVQYDPIRFTVDPAPPVPTDLRAALRPSRPMPGSTITITSLDACPPPTGPQTTSWDAYVFLFGDPGQPPRASATVQLSGDGTWRTALRVPRSADVHLHWTISASCGDTDQTDPESYWSAYYRNVSVPLHTAGSVSPNQGGEPSSHARVTCPPVDPGAVPGCGGHILPHPGDAGRTPTPIGSTRAPSGKASGRTVSASGFPASADPSLAPAAGSRRHDSGNGAAIAILAAAGALLLGAAAWGYWYWRRGSAPQRPAR